MSHFTKVRSKITDAVCLKSALKDLGYTFVEAKAGQTVHVRGYQQATAEAAMSIEASSRFDVGVVVTAEGIEFVADWWGVETTRGVTQDEFIRQVTQRYAYHKVKKAVEKHNYKLELVEAKVGEKVMLRVSRWA